MVGQRFLTTRAPGGWLWARSQASARAQRARIFHALVFCASGMAVLSPDLAHAAAREAASKGRPLARVLSETASIYSGPGFGFRVIAVAKRDDVLKMLERGKRGGWTRVELETGLAGWVLSEQVLIFGDDPAADANVGPFRRFGRKLRAAVLGPPNLLSARAAGAWSAGALGGEGLFLVRPSVFISPNVAIEAYVGPSVGREVSRGLFGASANIYLSPAIPFTVFISAGGGGVFSRGKVDNISDAEWRYMVSPGGGLWVILKRGVGLRFDFRNHLFFRANSASSKQEYSGAIAFSF